jgi:periplasmic divalent cation tolerance protein
MPGPAAATAAVDTAYVEVHVTTPDGATAARLARVLVEERLAACVQVLPGVTSVYRWNGAVESAEEHLLLVKTTASAFEAIRERIGSEHPYDTPEVLALPVVAVAPGYAAWLTASVDAGPGRGSPPPSTEDLP